MPRAYCRMPYAVCLGLRDSRPYAVCRVPYAVCLGLRGPLYTNIHACFPQAGALCHEDEAWEARELREVVGSVCVKAGRTAGVCVSPSGEAGISGDFGVSVSMRGCAAVGGGVGGGRCGAVVTADVGRVSGSVTLCDGEDDDEQAHPLRVSLCITHTLSGAGATVRVPAPESVCVMQRLMHHGACAMRIRMLTYAHGSSRMLTDAAACWRMQVPTITAYVRMVLVNRSSLPLVAGYRWSRLPDKTNELHRPAGGGPPAGAGPPSYADVC